MAQMKPISSLANMDSNCTLGEKCKTHGVTREFEESLINLGEGETLMIGSEDNKTIIRQLVNGGAYGQIFTGELKDGGIQVAIKIEQQGSGHEKILSEGNVYRKLEGILGIPKVYWYGMHGHLYNVLVMELLGPSLNALFENNNDHLSLKTVLLIIDQVYDIFKYIHKKGFLHRDISPSNFVMGARMENCNQVYLIDFGLAYRIDQPGMFAGNASRRQSAFLINNVVVGTPRYVSVGAHHGYDPTYKDDVEALSYMWVYLLKGKLPWMGITATSYVEKLLKIADVKAHMSGREICTDIPDEFALNIDYCRNLKPLEMPNYAAIKKMFRDLAGKRQIEYDNQYDWSMARNELLLGSRIRCESNSTPSSLITNKKIRMKLLPQINDPIEEVKFDNGS